MVLVYIKCCYKQGKQHQTTASYGHVFESSHDLRDPSHILMSQASEWHISMSHVGLQKPLTGLGHHVSRAPACLALRASASASLQASIELVGSSDGSLMGCLAEVEQQFRRAPAWQSVCRSGGGGEMMRHDVCRSCRELAHESGRIGSHRAFLMDV